MSNQKTAAIKIKTKLVVGFFILQCNSKIRLPPLLLAFSRTSPCYLHRQLMPRSRPGRLNPAMETLFDQMSRFHSVPSYLQIYRRSTLFIRFLSRLLAWIGSFIFLGRRQGMSRGCILVRDRTSTTLKES